MPASPAQVAVVIATRNRGPELLGTLARLRALEEQPPIVVVDNGSTDGTSKLVRTHHDPVTRRMQPFLHGQESSCKRSRGSRMVS